MNKYRKKPVIIEAIQFNGLNINEILQFSGQHWKVIDGKIRIPTLEGNMFAQECDYIIKGIKGEFYPCKPDIFEATYEMVEDE